MIEGLAELRTYFEQLFKDGLAKNAYIEVSENELETVLSANQEGLLLLAGQLVRLCDDERKFDGRHYHLDESGMAYACEKPMTFCLTNAPWEIALPEPGTLHNDD